MNAESDKKPDAPEEDKNGIGVAQISFDEHGAVEGLEGLDLETLDGVVGGCDRYCPSDLTTQ